MGRYKAVALDLDGVVWRGHRPIERNIEAIRKLRARGVKTIFLSNNATRSRLEYAEVLKRYGLHADVTSIVNSAYAATKYSAEHGGRTVFIVGEAGLYYEAVVNGLMPVTIGSEADHVIVAMDRFVTYNKLAYACRLIHRGSMFIAANMDMTYPVEEGLDPGAGTIVSFLSACSDRRPDFIAGKPNPYILETALKINDLGKDEILIVGDRLDTDIMLGVNAGVDTLLVLTGVSRVEDIEKTGISPTYVAKDLLDFIEQYPDLF
jgi:4-nitrophenyl phosphatase